MEEATIAKIASEALKPVSSLIDALLSARIQRIKNWAEKQELTNRLGSIAIDELLDQYLRHLLRRVCGITTIIFPQQILPLTAIYEPLMLTEKYGATEHKSHRLGVKTLEPGHNYLIVDSAGMGKSTFAKHLVLEILNLTTKIPLFLELRRIKDSETLLEMFSKEIDKTQNDVNEKLLLMLLDQGNYVIILDGYDELPEDTRNKIGQQITDLAIRCDKNSLILTSRPEVALPEIPDSSAFTIDHLTREQAKSLVLRYDAVADLDVGKRLIHHFDNVSKQFLETPLLIALLYRTYGFNQSIATRISSFYDEIFNALYKGHDLSKAGFARAKSSRLDSEDFRRLLRGFSFILAVHQKDILKNNTEGIKIIEEATKLTSIKPSSASAFFDDLLLAVPFLVKDGPDFRFVHKSIGEFFTAEFLAYAPNSEQIIERIKNGNLYKSFINSFQFLSEINPNLFRKLIAAPLAKTILDEDEPIRDPYIRSLCFTHQVKLSIWPYQKYTRNMDGRKNVLIPSPKGKFTSTYYFYGRLNRKKYILAASHSKAHKNIPLEAWKLLTKEARDKVADTFSHMNNAFKDIDKFLVQEQWIAINDKRILDNSNHKAIRGVIGYLLRHADLSRTGNRTRIIDEDACKDLLLQIRQEHNSQEWLESLISGRRKR